MTTIGTQDEGHTVVLTGSLLRSFLLLTLREADRCWRWPSWLLVLNVTGR